MRIQASCLWNYRLRNIAYGVSFAMLVLVVISLFSRDVWWQLIIFLVAAIVAFRSIGLYGGAMDNLDLHRFEQLHGTEIYLGRIIDRVRSLDIYITLNILGPRLTLQMKMLLQSMSARN
jgi:hypothetical protein